MATLRFTLRLILGIAIPYAIQRWDRARLSPAQRAAAWNGASWASALYGFGPISMVGWAWVTRQRFRSWYARDGLALALLKSVALLLGGLAAAIASGAAISCVDWAIDALAGDP